MQLYYVPDLRTNPVLPFEEARHCLKVLRMKKGDIIMATDGMGNFYRGEIVEPDFQGITGHASASLSNHTSTSLSNHARNNMIVVNVLETIPQPPLWKGRIEIAIAPTKNIDRIEWFAEKATETGIDKISFLRCRFSERKEMHIERIRKIMISAMKQSEKALLPDLHGMSDFKDFIKQDFDGQKFIAHCHKGYKKLLSQAYKKNENALVLIGPEGDFSEEEIMLAIEQGFIPISLGASRLRTETAALIACQTFHIVNQIGNE